jgi:hypothetical protein
MHPSRRSPDDRPPVIAQLIAEVIAEPIAPERDGAVEFKSGLFHPGTALSSRIPTYISGTAR